MPETSLLCKLSKAACSLLPRVTALEAEFSEVGPGSLEIIEGLQNDFRMGCVKLYRPGMDDVYYPPEFDTNSSRWAQLQLALGQSQLTAITGSKITIIQGRFDIPSAMILSNPLANTKIIFGPSSSIVYFDENDAALDSSLFEGNNRYGINFGIDSLETGIDMHPRLQAALFSMPAFGDPGIIPPSDYPLMENRKGVLYLMNGEFLCSSVLHVSSFQSIEGMEGRETQIIAGAGMAPAGSDIKHLIETANHPQGAPFVYNICFRNLLLVNYDNVGNVQLRGLLYGCGQGGDLDITTLGFCKAGVYFRPATSATSFKKISVFDESNVSTEPGIIMSGCANLTIDLLNVERSNYAVLPTPKKTWVGNYDVQTNTFVMPAIYMVDCHSINIGVCKHEQVASAIVLYWCQGITIGAIDCSMANNTGVGRTLAVVNACEGINIHAINGSRFTKLLEFSGPSNAVTYEILANNESFKRAPAFLMSPTMASPQVQGSLRLNRADNLGGTEFSLFTSGTEGVYSSFFVQDTAGYLHMRIANYNSGYAPGSAQDTTGYNIILDDGPAINSPGTMGAFIRSKLKVIGQSTLNNTTWDNNSTFSFGNTTARDNLKTALGITAFDPLSPGPIGTITSDVINGTVIHASIEYKVAGTKVLGAQESAITDVGAFSAGSLAPSSSPNPTDLEYDILAGEVSSLASSHVSATNTINSILVALRNHGIIDT